MRIHSYVHVQKNKYIQIIYIACSLLFKFREGIFTVLALYKIGADEFLSFFKLPIADLNIEN